MNLLEEVKKKREFKGLPDSVVLRVLEGLDDFSGKEKVKEARVVLRKYFGVFLTNKVIKPKDIMDYEAVLKSHKSSMKRDYSQFYEKIMEGLGEKAFEAIIDLGCGLNGFSYEYIRKEIGDVNYIGVEAASQVTDNTNRYFNEGGFGDRCASLWGDLFDLDYVSAVLERCQRNRLVFLFQVVDALENLEENFSRDFLEVVGERCEYMVISLPTESLSGRKKFEVKRKWLMGYLEERFEVLSDYEMNGERFIVLRT